MPSEHGLEIIHGPDLCPIFRPGGSDGEHEWQQASVDPDDRQAFEAHLERYPGLAMCHAELLSHSTCKHCAALAVDAEEAE